MFITKKAHEKEMLRCERVIKAQERQMELYRRMLNWRSEQSLRSSEIERRLDVLEKNAGQKADKQVCPFAPKC